MNTAKRINYRPSELASERIDKLSDHILKQESRRPSWSTLLDRAAGMLFHQSRVWQGVVVMSSPPDRITYRPSDLAKDALTAIYERHQRSRGSASWNSILNEAVVHLAQRYAVQHKVHEGAEPDETTPPEADAAAANRYSDASKPGSHSCRICKAAELLGVSPGRVAHWMRREGLALPSTDRSEMAEVASPRCLGLESTSWRRPGRVTKGWLTREPDGSIQPHTEVVARGSVDLAKAKEVAEQFSQLYQLFMRLGQVRRTTLHPDGEEESDATHTVALAAASAHVAISLGHDPRRAVMLALVHDLAEVYAGDVSTARPLTEDEKLAKREAELEASRRIADETPWAPWLHELMTAYERQADPTARLVCVLDKSCPRVTHLASGLRGLFRLGMDVAEIRSVIGNNDEGLRAQYPEQEEALAIRDCLGAAVLGALDQLSTPSPEDTHRIRPCAGQVWKHEERDASFMVLQVCPWKDHIGEEWWLITIPDQRIKCDEHGEDEHGEVAWPIPGFRLREGS